jgi:hypothetical protein
MAKTVKVEKTAFERVIGKLLAPKIEPKPKKKDR